MKNNGIRNSVAAVSLVALSGAAFGADNNAQGVSQTMDLVPNAAKGQQLQNGSWVVTHGKGGPAVSHEGSCGEEFIMTAKIKPGNKSILAWAPRLDAIKHTRDIGFVRPGTAEVSGDQVFDYSQKGGQTPDDVNQAWIDSGLVPSGVVQIQLKFPGMQSGCGGDGGTPPGDGGGVGGGGCAPPKDCTGGPKDPPPVKQPPVFPGP